MLAASSSARPSIAVHELLERALAFQQRKQFPDAEGCYQRILEDEPENFDALHMLGVIAAQTSRPERAVTLINRALQLRADVAAAFDREGSLICG